MAAASGKVVGYSVCVCLSALILPTAFLQATEVHADDSTASMSAILERLERLEQDNRALRETVRQLEQTGAGGGARIVAPEPPAASGVTAAELQQQPSAVSSPEMKAASLHRTTSDSVYQSASPAAVFADSQGQPFLTETEVRHIIEEALEQQPRSLSTTPFPTMGYRTSPDTGYLMCPPAPATAPPQAPARKFPTLTVNGVFQADAGWFHQDAASEGRYGQIADGADFRRARLSAKGSVAENTNYFFQMDFAFFGRPTFTDVWAEQTDVPVLGNVRIGQWKQPFSLEVVSSFRYTTFMERSVLFQSFTPFRHLGIGFYDHSDDLTMTWAASLFRSGQDQFGGTLSSDGGYGTSERVTWLPVWQEKGREYLHLGLGHFFNSPPGDTVNFRTNPELYVGANAPGAVGSSGQAVPGAANGTPFFAETGNISTAFYNVLGTELLWVHGPLSAQSETMINFVSPSGGTGAVLYGTYAQVGYFLTGEHRPYDRASGAIDRVIPRSSLAFSGPGSGMGCGAWEVAGRVSWLDLNDAAINGGTLLDYTAGINWYCNPYTKLVFNYVHAISNGTAAPQANTDIFGVRAQVDF